MLQDHVPEELQDNFRCEKCEKTFKWKKNLLRHMREGHGIFERVEEEEEQQNEEDLPHPCHVCN